MNFPSKKDTKIFILILVYLDTQAIIALLPFRDKLSIISYFKALRECFCNQVEVYSSDMWQPFLDIA
ncbi:transposase [Bernardetia litoralis]|uniref:transposase n=1 Tax=Bernardetia litoralis TaxID=999 RepID=UPI0009758A0D